MLPFLVSSLSAVGPKGQGPRERDLVDLSSMAVAYLFRLGVDGPFLD